MMSYTERFKKRKELLENLKKEGLPPLLEGKNQPRVFKPDTELSSKIYSQNQEFYSFNPNLKINKEDIEKFLKDFKNDFKKPYREEIDKEIQEQCKKIKNFTIKFIGIAKHIMEKKQADPKLEEGSLNDISKDSGEKKQVDSKLEEVLPYMLPYIEGLCELYAQYAVEKNMTKKRLRN